ncbi:MAG TPA: carboxypeptidase-like regulatory domain-containing protein, partial [Blastocatellia bacterium]|nr:carboxypeptidase-like regulatory domain-containing protein [Blastocatellia bacterium]
ITLAHKESYESLAGVSLDDGSYTFASLKPGYYTLSVRSSFFQEKTVDSLPVRENEAATASVVMAALPGQNGGTVTAQGAVSVTTSGAIAISPPEPLRELYFDSELIVVASVGKSVTAEEMEYGAMKKTALQITSTVKGKSGKRVVYVYHWESKDVESQFTEGESLLLFLNRREAERGKRASDGYRIKDESYGLKKLSAPDLSVYLQRMKELDAMSRDAKDNPAEVVDWLVRCAEDPATRWEGSYELARSARNIEGEKELAASEAEAEPATEPQARDSAVDPDLPQLDSADLENAADPDEEPEFAALLTGRQKERLMASLFKTDAASYRESDLIYLARIWDDKRLVPYLVSQLRRMEGDPTSFAGAIAKAISDTLKDEEISSLADEYDGATFEEEGALGSGESEGHEGQDQSLAAEPEQEPDGPEVREVSVGEARRERSAMIKRFLAAVESRMKAMEAKANPD